MNNQHLKNEEEYLNDLMSRVDKMNMNDQEKIERAKKIKATNEIILTANNLKKEELMKLKDSELSEKLKTILPNQKNSKNNMINHQKEEKKNQDECIYSFVQNQNVSN